MAIKLKRTDLFPGTALAVMCLVLSGSVLASLSTGVAESHAPDNTTGYLEKLSVVQPEMGRVAGDIVTLRRDMCGEQLSVAQLRDIIAQDPAYYELLRVKTTGEGDYASALDAGFGDCGREGVQ